MIDRRQTPLRQFIDGFASALWVGERLSTLGVLAALLSPGRQRDETAVTIVQEAIASAGEPNASPGRAERAS